MDTTHKGRTERRDPEKAKECNITAIRIHTGRRTLGVNAGHMRLLGTTDTRFLDRTKPAMDLASTKVDAYLGFKFQRIVMAFAEWISNELMATTLICFDHSKNSLIVIM